MKTTLLKNDTYKAKDYAKELLKTIKCFALKEFSDFCMSTIHINYSNVYFIKTYKNVYKLHLILSSNVLNCNVKKKYSP